MNRGDPGYEAGIGRDAGRRKAARNQPIEAKRRGWQTTNDMRVKCPECGMVGSPRTIGRHLKFRHDGEPTDCRCGWRYDRFCDRPSLRAKRLPAALAWHKVNRCPLRKARRREMDWCAKCSTHVGPNHAELAHPPERDPLACPWCDEAQPDVATRNEHVLNACEKRPTEYDPACPHCGDEFPHPGNLRQHVESCKWSTGARMRDLERRRAGGLECIWGCGESFPTRADRDEHDRTCEFRDGRRRA